MKNLRLFGCISVIALMVGYLSFGFRGANIFIDTKPYVTLGDINAKNHIIVLEEFACIACQRFHLEDLPYLLTNYIDPGIAKITLIPMAYLEASEAACKAALLWEATENENYLSFLKFIFKNPLQYKSARDFIEEFKKSLPTSEFSLEAYEESLFDEYMEKGRMLCDQLYESEIHMPTIIINNKRIKDISLKSIEGALIH